MANEIVIDSHDNHLSRPTDEGQIAAMFDRVAPRYDFLNALLSLKQDRRWRGILVALIPFKPAGSLLDVATGTGDVVFAAMTQRKEYAGFTGVDISEKMLALAGLKSHEQKLANMVQFRQMSAEKLELPDGSFDCVTISFGLRNVVDKEAALKEFSRVLKPKGTLLIMEFFTPRSSVMAKIFDFYFRNILPVIGGLFSDREAYTYLPRSVSGFYSPDQLRGALYRAGFLVNQEVSFLFGACKIIQARRLA